MRGGTTLANVSKNKDQRETPIQTPRTIRAPRPPADASLSHTFLRLGMGTPLGDLVVITALHQLSTAAHFIPFIDSAPRNINKQKPPLTPVPIHKVELD